MSIDYQAESNCFVIPEEPIVQERRKTVEHKKRYASERRIQITKKKSESSIVRKPSEVSIDVANFDYKGDFLLPEELASGTFKKGSVGSGSLTPPMSK